MKTKHSLLVLLLLTVFYSGLTSCGGTREPKETSTNEEGTNYPTKSQVTYNIYVENSGSMKGYCDINNKFSLESLVNDYYHVLHSQDDIITLNFINTSIERGADDINIFQKSIKSKCTASYTKIDDMLKMMMDSVRNDCVNLLISDYVFSTDGGNLQMASNAIADMFTMELKHKDLAVVIYKYMVDFNGKYYPGGLQCNKPLPLYVWAFGNKENLRELTRLPFTSKECGKFFLHKSINLDFKLEAGSDRVTSSDKKKIYVSKWKKDRRGDFYEFKLTANLKDVLLTDKEILTKSCYQIKSNNSSKYKIENINDIGKDKYEYTIRTDGTTPAPGELVITYPTTIPAWVERSNFEGKGIPTDSTTYGVSYLINGVNKAFKDVSEGNYYYFEININLE